MILEFIKFEWTYRKKRSATWIYALIVLLLLPLLSTQMFGSNKSSNSNYELVENSLIFSIILLPIISAIMGVSIIRDTDYQMTSLILSKPVSRLQLYLGRFLGSFLIVLMIFSMSIFGLILSVIIEFGELPNYFSILTILKSFLFFSLPNSFFFAVLFYGLAGLIQKRSWSYSQGFIMLISLQLLYSSSRKFGVNSLFKYFDPLGFTALRFETMYLKASEKTIWIPTMGSTLLINRLIFIFAGIILFLIFNYFFSYKIKNSSLNYKKFKIENDHLSLTSKPVFTIKRDTGIGDIEKFLISSVFYCKIILRETFFIVISSVGILFTLFQLYQRFNLADRPLYATTANIILILSGGISTFLSVLSIYYAGDIIFKEKNVGFTPILESSPASKWIILASKFLGFIESIMILTAMILIVGILFQVSMGNFDIKWSAYFWEGFIFNIIEVILMMALYIFIQSIIGNRNFGPIVSVSVLFGLGFGSQFGFENPLYSYSSQGFSNYNDWNGYGQSFEHYLWSKLYWASLALVLFTLAIPIQFIDTAQNKWDRFKNIGSRLSLGMKTTIFTSLAIFIIIGFFIYYQVEFIGEGFQTSSSAKSLRANYERKFEKYETILQPKITKIDLKIDFPQSREMKGKAMYVIKNRTQKPLDSLFLQEPFSDQAFQISNMKLNRASTDNIDIDFKFHAIKLEKPLLPNDSLIINFDLAYKPLHFAYMSSYRNINIIENGSSFQSNLNMISIGFNRNYLLKNSDDREAENLNKNQKTASINHPILGNSNAIAHDADLIDLDIEVRCDASQSVAGIGQLIKKSNDKNHKTYRFSSKNIPNKFAFTVGNFKTITENINGILVEYHYHPNHSQNIETIKKAAKDALGFMNKNIANYPFKKLTIAETAPLNNEETASFPGLILLREGFMTSKGKDPDLIFDRTYETIVNSISKMWFEFSVSTANVHGSQILRQATSNLMSELILEKNFGNIIKNDFLKQNHQLFRSEYKSQNQTQQTIEKTKEASLILNRSTVMLSMLKAKIGNENMIKALKNFYLKFNNSAKYATFKDLMVSIENIIDKKTNIKDYYERQIFHDHRIIGEVKIIKNKTDYTYIVSYQARKYEINNKNKEINLIHDEPFEFGIIDQNDKILEVIKVNPTSLNGVFNIKSKFNADKIMIDPNYHFFDLIRLDNTSNL